MPAPKKTAKKPKKPSSAVTYTKPLEEIPAFYANNTNATVSAYDFKLIFGQLCESTNSGVTVDPQMAVFFSPQHAKAIADLLIGQIKAYEERTGQLLSNPPPQIK